MGPSTKDLDYMELNRLLTILYPPNEPQYILQEGSFPTTSHFRQSRARQLEPFLSEPFAKMSANPQIQPTTSIHVFFVMIDAEAVIVVIGDGRSRLSFFRLMLFCIDGSGKTSLISKLITNKFPPLVLHQIVFLPSHYFFRLTMSSLNQ
jgi:hypothetical protein